MRIMAQREREKRATGERGKQGVHERKSRNERKQ